MKEQSGWQHIQRKTVYDTPFLKVHEDTVRLPNGETIPNYTVIEKPSIVVIAATNTRGQVLLVHEFKYGARRFLWGLPAGHIHAQELPIAVAKKELEEETGYQAARYTVLGTLKEYPSKDTHTVTVVKAHKITPTGIVRKEPTETIDTIRFFSKKALLASIKNEDICSATTIAALVFAGIFR